MWAWALTFPSSYSTEFCYVYVWCTCYWTSVCFSLVNLSLVDLICRALAGKPWKVEGKIFLFPTTSLKDSLSWEKTELRVRGEQRGKSLQDRHLERGELHKKTPEICRGPSSIQQGADQQCMWGNYLCWGRRDVWKKRTLPGTWNSACPHQPD